MNTMKAYICPKYGPAEVLQLVEYPRPSPKANEVLIKIYATSVTDSDIFIRSSKVERKLIIPFRLMMGILGPRKAIIGEVLAGEVVQVGSKIRRFHAGDQVYGLTGFSLGAYADYKCMKETDSKQGCLAHMPGNISFEEATAAAYGGLLALQQLEKGNIQPKQQVLIYGASGTSGIIAIQYAKHRGAAVTAVCSARHIPFVQSLGADVLLDYTKDESISQLGVYDLVLDAVGKRRTSKLREACKRSLTAKGRYVSIDDEALALNSERLARIAELVESKAIVPVNDRCYNFEKMIDAHRYVELGHKQGNVAITVNTKER
jgi:NADPH:quinone reductase-like Zn-dependent oxidoreductase